MNRLLSDIIGTNLLTKFHEDRKINVVSGQYKKKCPAPDGHVFKATAAMKFYDPRQNHFRTHDRKINPRPCVGHVFQPTGIIFKFVQDIIGMNLLTEFHEDRTINVASRVKNAPPLGGHVIQANVTIFELIQDIIKTNLLA
ncbi:hypothetical protein DPMN_179872 [Dreissena polymorpha]|uniref:Uncharacterized protein n=1 Tax=Dreissena polymorpha TaxID=45954 RepID=A0A9D4IML0_DREPO|nr:hypothetical protein DPMN_179872 [Dreissena polymorpha]